MTMILAAGASRRRGGGPPPGGGASYGPDGTHWPTDTPQAGHVHVVDVAASWSAIATAINAVTPTQAAEGVLIRVAPGTLGEGTSVIPGGAGSSAWPQNVLVQPRDGWGTTNLGSDTTIVGVHGVTFARFNVGGRLKLTDCSHTNWCWSKVGVGLRTYAVGETVVDCNIYEAVLPNAVVSTEDSIGYAAVYPGVINGNAWVGCYAAPLFRPEGSSAHLDTFQMFGTGGGDYRGLTFIDSALFGSSNCALQLGGGEGDTPYLTLDHSLVVSQAMAVQTRYSPAPVGAVEPYTAQAINGAGEPYELRASNETVVLGSMHVTEWASVTDSTTSHDAAPVNNPSLVGGWVYDSDLVTMTPAQLDAICPDPTDTYLAGIWA